MFRTKLILTIAITCIGIGSWSRSGSSAELEKKSPDQFDGRDLFLHQWEPNDELSGKGDGLGPLFNGRSCVECHSQGGVGGAGDNTHNAQFLSFLPETGDFSDDGLEVFLGNLKGMHPDFVDKDDQFSLGVLLHRKSTNPDYAPIHERVTAEVPNDFNTRLRIRRMLRKRDIRGIDALPLNLVIFDQGLQYATAERNPPQLFGIDDIDKQIRDADLKQLVETQKLSRTGVSGRMAGKFGWRGQMRSLDLFVKGACAIEIGLQVPEFHQTADPLRPEYELKGADLNEKQISLLVNYVRELPRPERVMPADDDAKALAIEGQNLFTAVGCAECHVTDVGSLKEVYSDFLLHDMGQQFEDPIPAEPKTETILQENMDVISSYHGMVRRKVTTELVRELAIEPEQHREYKTPPLWGVADSAPYLHDGRATTLRAAIEWHGGEAYSSYRRFSLLKENQQFALLKFLETLRAPSSAEPAPPQETETQVSNRPSTMPVQSR
ncbi:di-heme oxidoredictase family protein [Bremerella cremea]|uniref:di-heme oxidoredictase family protein n=1 Tax=Bremerella cremea TaxID=1031537 RepID=UPI0031E6C868